MRFLCSSDWCLLSEAPSATSSPVQVNNVSITSYAMEALADAGFRVAALLEKVKAFDSSKFPENFHALAPKLACEADRFQLWAVNLGLFVSGHASLDYRVRDAGTIRSAAQRLISSLEDALTEGCLLCQTAPAAILTWHQFSIILVTLLIPPRKLTRRKNFQRMRLVATKILTRMAAQTPTCF